MMLYEMCVCIFKRQFLKEQNSLNTTCRKFLSFDVEELQFFIIIFFVLLIWNTKSSVLMV